MRTKLHLLVFAMLTVCAMQSQDITANNFSKVSNFGKVDTTDTRPISFPFWMVKAIALDLEEKSRLELEAQLYALEVETYQSMITTLEEKDQKRRLQLELLEKNAVLLQEQLWAEQQSDKGVGTLVWSLRLLCALGAGFILGRI